MAKKGFDFKRLLLASALIIGIGIMLVILSTILQLLTGIVTGQTLTTVEMVNTIFSIILFPVFFLLYLWCGFRAARRYGFDAVGSAWVTTFSFLIVAIVQLALDIILTLIFVSRPMTTTGFGSVESAIAAFLFGPTADVAGVGLAALCGVGVVIFGGIINFVVGGVGAIIALRRSS